MLRSHSTRVRHHRSLGRALLLRLLLRRRLCGGSVVSRSLCAGRGALLGRLGGPLRSVGPWRGPWAPRTPGALHVCLHHGHVLVLHVLSLHGHELPLHLEPRAR